MSKKGKNPSVTTITSHPAAMSRRRMFKTVGLGMAAAGLAPATAASAATGGKSAVLVKEKDVTIYRNEKSYSHNACLGLQANGEMLCVVQEQKRRKYRTHIDPTSKTILLRSKDKGLTWDPATKTTVVEIDSEAVNDPHIVVLKDGTLIVNYFTWRCATEEEAPINHPTIRRLDGVNYSWLVGAFSKRSTDGGRSWEPQVQVPPENGSVVAVSDPPIELPNGDLLMPTYTSPNVEERAVVYRSTDSGQSWKDPVTVCEDPFGHFQFSEPSLLYLPSGKLICMIRVHQKAEEEYGDYLYQSDSFDMGKTWSPPVKTPMWGHPPHLLRLASGNVLCVYGYRRIPYGSRACLSHDEGKTWDIQNELILRKDGIDRDVGYPTSVQLPDGKILTSWYLCEADPATPQARSHFANSGVTLGYIGATFYRET